MKTILFVLVFTLLYLNSFSQIKGVNLSEAKVWSKESDLVYEVLGHVISGDKEGYLIPFELTPVGLWHCVEKAKKIVEMNDLKFNSPNVSKDELFEDGVKGFTDYSILCLSIKTESSEVNWVWQTVSGDKITLLLSGKLVAIIFGPAKK